MYIYVNILFNNNYLINDQFIHQRTLSTFFFFLGFEDKQHLVSKLYFT